MDIKGEDQEHPKKTNLNTIGNLCSLRGSLRVEPLWESRSHISIRISIARIHLNDISKMIKKTRKMITLTISQLEAEEIRTMKEVFHTKLKEADQKRNTPMT